MQQTPKSDVDAGARPLVRVKDLRKSYGDIEVLKGISLDIQNGEVISIIGASGSGKSTFLRCINLMEIPSGGQTQFGNYWFDYEPSVRRKPSPRELCDLRSQIGMVFQSYNLWPHMTVLQNVIEAPVHVRNMPRQEAVSRAEALLQRIGLYEKRDSYPSHLSGGQQQRVAIARALAMTPKVMLFDEVTSALDPELVGEVLTLISSLAAEGMTMLIVTHEMAFARDVGTRTLFFDNGIIAEDGLPDDVIGSPKTDRLRQFLRRLHGGASHQTA